MRFMSRKQFLLPATDILATETTQRLKAGILARIYLLFFWCTVVWQHDSGAVTPSAKTGFKVNDSLWFGPETVHHHGMGDGGVVATGDLTNRAKDTFNVVPRRHRLSWCNFRETKGTLEETGACGDLETPAKRIKKPPFSSYLFVCESGRKTKETE